MKNNILITGRPGIGKTTLIIDVASKLDVCISGFYTEEIRKAGNRVGFSIKTFDGEEATLSHVDIKSSKHVGKYRVDVVGFEKIALPAIAPNAPVCLIVIDEIGKMECLSARFRDALTKVFDSSTPLLATIALKGTPFIEKLKNRPDVETFELTRANRDTHAPRILSAIRPLLPPTQDDDLV